MRKTSEYETKNVTENRTKLVTENKTEYEKKFETENMTENVKGAIQLSTCLHSSCFRERRTLMSEEQTAST